MDGEFVQSPSNFLSFIFLSFNLLLHILSMGSGVECLALLIYVEKLQINKPVKGMHV